MVKYCISLRENDILSEANLIGARASFAMLQQQIIKAPVLRHLVSISDIHVILFANYWALSSTSMQIHDGFLQPVRCCGRVLKEREINYHPAEREVLALL